MDRHLRIGVFGGTFDPIHAGHLETAEAVHRTLDLDRMLLVVANEPWQKEGSRSVTPAEDRLAMVEAAVAGRPGLEASRLEIDRGGPSYTVDTVDQLHSLYPGSELFLVVGADVVPDLTDLAQRSRAPGVGGAGGGGPSRVHPGEAPAGVERCLGAGPALRRVEHGAPSPPGSGQTGRRFGT